MIQFVNFEQKSNEAFFTIGNYHGASQHFVKKVKRNISNIVSLYLRSYLLTMCFFTLLLKQGTRNNQKQPGVTRSNL